MFPALPLLVALLACQPSEAERLVAAAAASTVEQALAACPEASGECKAQAVVRFGAWPRCVEVPDPWDDECRFRQAEALEHVGDGAGALEICASTRYVVGCATHVAGQQARRADTIADANARWDSLKDHTEARYAFAYWRGFWRTHVDRGDAPPLEACASRVCSEAGGKEIEATVDQLAVPCAALDRPPPGWIPEGSARSFAAWTEALSHHCVPDAEHPVPAPIRREAEKR